MRKINDGMILQDRYQVIRKIGEGGMSDVFLVKDLHLGKYWALKRIDLNEDTEWRMQAYMVEKEFLRCVNHPVFPMLADSFTENNYCYLVMEFVEGETLESYLKRKKRMKLADADRLIRQIMDALSYLHKHTPAIIYGDLKPANIMLQQDKRGRLLDFGSAMWGTQRFMLGTPEYAAPEQVSKEYQVVDERSDIYGVGVLYAEMLTGRKAGGTYLEDPFLPKCVRTFIFRCTRVNPAERFQSMEEAIKALDERDEKKAGHKRLPFLLQDVERIVLTEYDSMLESGQREKENRKRGGNYCEKNEER